MNRLFITGTDTGVGKTVVTATLAALLRRANYRVGVIKPVQCAGNDAAWLKKVLDLPQPLNIINPFYAPEPLSPHLALTRAHKKFDLKRIHNALVEIEKDCDIVLIEGAGGLLVPLKKGYTNADLARDLNADIVIISRLGLGTINHTLLSVSVAQAQGLAVKGIVFSDAKGGKKSVPEQTNPCEIGKLTKTPILGTVPYLSPITLAKLKKCPLNLKPLFAGTVLNAKALKQDDRDYIWHPFTQMKDWVKEDPLIIDSADGVYLKDIDGNRYIDGVSSLWVNVHGHRKPEIDRAIKNQIDHVAHSTLLGLSNTPAVVLSKKLIEIAPHGLKKVFYSDNGSTAVEIALKMAYQYWQNIGQTKKTTLVHLENYYHGDTLGSVSVGGIDLFHKVYKGLIFKTHGLKGQGQEAVEEFESLLKRKAAHVAAIVVEPLVQGAAGMLVWPRGVLKKLKRLCVKYDVFLIVDEVATGFGRTGVMFACEHEGVVPDFLCVAKGLTGGYLPLAATLTTERIYKGFIFDYKEQKTFFHGHTYTGNPLACAAAIANLEIFKKERTLARLAPKIKYLAKRLKMFYNLPSVVEVRQCGFMVGIELKGKWEDRIGAKVCHIARRYGVILRPLGNVIVLMPPLSITRSQLADLLNATYSSISEL